jgi:hypothetical protein
MEKIPTAKELYLKTLFPSLFENKRDEVELWFETSNDAKEHIKAMIDFTKLHVEQALKEASESRCIKMHDKIWFAQSLEPGTKILDTVNITVDKDSILNSYPLENIK